MPPSQKLDPIAALAAFRYGCSANKSVGWSTVRSVDVQRLSTVSPDLQQMKMLTAALVDCNVSTLKVPALMADTAGGTISPADVHQLLMAFQVSLQFTLHSQACLRDAYAHSRTLLTTTEDDLQRLQKQLLSLQLASSTRASQAESSQQPDAKAEQLKAALASISRLEEEVRQLTAQRDRLESAQRTQSQAHEELRSECALLKGQNAALLNDLREARAVAQGVKAVPSWLTGAEVPTVRQSDRLEGAAPRRTSSHNCHHRHRHHRHRSDAAPDKPAAAHVDMTSIVGMMQQMAANALQQQQSSIQALQTMHTAAVAAQHAASPQQAVRRDSTERSDAQQGSAEVAGLRNGLLRLQSAIDELRSDGRRLEQLQDRDTKLLTSELRRVDDELQQNALSIAAAIKDLDRRPAATPSADSASVGAIADRITLVEQALRSARDELHARVDKLSQQREDQERWRQQVETGVNTRIEQWQESAERSARTTSASIDDLRRCIDDLRSSQLKAQQSAEANATRHQLPPVATQPGMVQSRPASSISSPVLANPTTQLPPVPLAAVVAGGGGSQSRPGSARTSEYGDDRRFYNDSEDVDPDLCPHCARAFPNMAEHAANCGYRPENCKYCGERYSVQSKELHLAHCKEYNRPAALRVEALRTSPNTSALQTPSASFVGPAGGVGLDNSGSVVLGASTKAPPPTPAIASGRAKTKELKALNDELAALLAEEAEAEARKLQSPSSF